MRIALLSDIHEDISSLEKAFRKIETCRCDEIVCLGDISGFSKNYRHHKHRDAEACLKLIRENCKIIIAGNHDLLSCKKLPVINPGFTYPKNWYELSYQQQIELSDKKVWLYEDEDRASNLTETDLEFLRSLPELEFLETGAGKILFSHYAFPNLTGSMSTFYDSANDFSGHIRWTKKQQCSFSFMGHQHPNGIVCVNEKRLKIKRFRKRIKIKNDLLIVLPPLVKHEVANLFCIFDTSTKKLEIKRI